MTPKEWLTANLSTDDDGQVVYQHPEGDCPVCGTTHPAPVVERIDPQVLADKYGMAMQSPPDALAGAVSDVAQAAVDAAEATDSGHERFFRGVV